MNIVLISGKHPRAAKSGYARYAAALARQLVLLHHHVHIYCAGSSASVTKTPIGTIHVVRVPFIQLLPGREMATLIPASILIARAIRKQSTINLVWGIGPWTLAGVFAGKKPLLADYFTTLTHEYGISLFTFLEKYILTKSSKILTHYRSTENILRRELRLTNFTRLPYSIDTTKIVRKKNTEKILLTVARRDPRKGIRYLLKAYAILQKRGITFRPIIVGPGQPMGPVDDLTALLSRAYCFVLPSLEEGGGSIAILEAMAAGLPIIATDIDGIPEDVEDGVSGFLVPPGNAKALAHAIEKLLTHAPLARRFGRNARVQYGKKYSVERIRTGLQKLLTSYGIARQR